MRNNNQVLKLRFPLFLFSCLFAHRTEERFQMQALINISLALLNRFCVCSGVRVHVCDVISAAQMH